MTDTYERIMNGTFESADIIDETFDGWIITEATPVCSTSPYAGVFCLKLTNTEHAEQIFPEVVVNNVTSFSFYHKGVGTSFLAIIYYSDATSNTVTVSCSATWLNKNLLSSLIAGKTVTKFRITNTSGSTIYIDNVSLGQPETPDEVTIQAAYLSSPSLLELSHTTQFEEDLEIKPAIKNVPLRTDGQVLEDDTWTEEPIQLSVVSRLTGSEKIILSDILDLNVKVYFRAGPWVYIGWVDKKEVKYSLSRESVSIDCDWETSLTIIVEYIQYCII